MNVSDSLRFLGIILRVLRLEVPVYNVYITNQLQTTGLSAGAYTTEYTELQRLLSGVHSVMRVKLALAGEGGGCSPTPFITFTITSKVAVYAPAEWADTLTLFHL
jgi:hypothetical protein